MENTQDEYELSINNDTLHINLPSSSEKFMEPSFISKVTENIVEPIKVLEMNFEQLDELDSISLGVLASFIEKAKDLDMVVRLYNVSDFVKNVLTIARFTDAVELH